MEKRWYCYTYSRRLGGKMIIWDISPKEIKEMRAKLGISSEELARMLDVSLRTMMRWQAGVSRPRPKYRRMLVQLYIQVFGHEPESARAEA